MQEHSYELSVRWTGNRGAGTAGYRSYDRTHEIETPGKPTIPASSDPAFRGDKSRWNPEELLVSAISQCHMLWYLHLAASVGVVVVDYTDHASGTMTEDDNGGGGQFTGVLLRPDVTVADPGMLNRAMSLHDQVGDKCFIARSVNFPIRHAPTVRVGPPGAGAASRPVPGRSTPAGAGPPQGGGEAG